MHKFNYLRDNHSDFLEELQLLEDVKFLLTHHQDFFKSYLKEEQKSDLIIFDTHKSTSSALRALQKKNESGLEEQQED